MRIGPWWLHPYTLKISFGVLVALLVLWWHAPRYGIERYRLLKWMWMLAIVAILSGRLGYVLGNYAYFAQNPTVIFRPDRVGGLHSGSAMAGGLLFAWIWARAMALRFQTVLDFLAPAALCVAAGAWWGCVDVGCAWGWESPLALGWKHWFVAELPDIYRTVAPRYAVQTLGAIWALTLAVLAGGRREWGGVIFGVYLSGSAGLTFLRADTVPHLGPLRSDIVLDLTLAAVVLASVVWRRSRTQISEFSRE